VSPVLLVDTTAFSMQSSKPCLLEKIPFLRSTFMSPSLAMLGLMTGFFRSFAGEFDLNGIGVEDAWRLCIIFLTLLWGVALIGLASREALGVFLTGDLKTLIIYNGKIVVVKEV